MVFSGRPSTACHACRPKRLKCDRVQSGCAQCMRRGIACPGYRDITLLRFRDDTDRVARKFQRTRRQKKSATLPPRDVAENLEGPPSTNVSCYPYYELIQSLPQAVNDVAITYFMSSYIVSSPFDEYLPNLYLSDRLSDDALSSAISATSLATFVLRFRCPRFINVSRCEYSRALNKTNAALANCHSVVLDRTLAAVLLLGLFEAVVFQGGHSPTSWTAHTYGAMELLRLRGMQQFRTKISQQLFAQVGNNIRTSCIQRSVAIPSEFLAFTDKVGPLLDLKDPAIRLAPVINKVAHIRAQYAKSPHPNLLHEALRLDLELVAFTNSLENELRYTFRPKADTPSWAYLNIAGSYPSLRVIRFWNAIRMLRIFLVTFIWDGISGDLDLTDLTVLDTATCKIDYVAYLREYSKKNLTEIANGVLASVPEFIERGDSGERFCPPARTLFWPLSILQESTLCPPMARNFALFCLDKLAIDLNMPQAIHPQKQPGYREDWLHLYHLG